jgi:hypothetical protein
MIGLTIDQIEEGDEAEIVRVAAERDIAGFVDAVGDDNPIPPTRPTRRAACSRSGSLPESGRRA